MNKLGKAYFLGLVFAWIFISLAIVSATPSNCISMQPLKTGTTPMPLIQYCVNCTFMNITSINYPNGSIQALNYQTQFIGGDTWINLTNSINLNQNGFYTYSTVGNSNGVLTSSCIIREVNPTGTDFNISQAILYVLILVIIFVILVFLLRSMMVTEKVQWQIGYFLVAYWAGIAFAFVAWSLANNYLFDIPILAQLLYYVWLVPLLVSWLVMLFSLIYILRKMGDELMVNKKEGYGYSRKEAEQSLRKK